MGCRAALAGLVLLAACGPTSPEDPLAAARTVEPAAGRRLLVETPLESGARAKVSLILAGRFGERSLPWLEDALRRFTSETWPDRYALARALGLVPGAASRDLLLRILREEKDWTLRRETLQALALRRDEPGVREAVVRVAREEGDAELRAKAEEILAGWR